MNILRDFGIGQDVGISLHMRLFWYFAYGSNMNPERLITDRLAPEGVLCHQRILGRLDGWSLAFDKPSVHLTGAAAANIKPLVQAYVLGTLNLIPEQGLDVLDHYEGVATQQYERAQIRVMRPDTGAFVDAVTYIARNNLDPALKPPSSYLAHLLAGRDLLPEYYVDRLAAVSVYDELT